MITGIITFLIIFAVIGSILYGQRLIKSVKVEHGNVKSNCFIIDKKLAYISDVSKIYNKDFRFFLLR